MRETFEINGLTVRIEQEENVQSPRENGDTDLFLVAKHRGFYVPSPRETRVPENVREVVDKYKKTHWIFPLEAYIHGGVCLALDGEGNFPDRQWDVSRVGFVFAAKNKWRLQKSAHKAALALIETWNQYLSNDVWYWTLTDSEGGIVDSCGDVYGFEVAKRDATAAATWKDICIE